MSDPAASASPEEAAALVAALERFMRETAPGAGMADASGPGGGDPWLTQAILEGVAREPSRVRGEDTPHPWINT